MQELETFYMQKAVNLAKKAASKGEVPIGAIVVNSNGVIIGKGYNKTESKKCQSRHAEIIAIENACKKIGDWRLEGCSLYVTLEPCIMCVGLISISRISHIIYAAPAKLYGFKEFSFFPDIYKKHIKSFKSGVYADLASNILKNFFKQKRSRNE